MPSTRSPHAYALPTIAMALALGTTTLAQAAAPTAQGTIDAAKASPLHVGSFPRAEISKRGLAKIQVEPGVEMDFKQYVTETALDKHAAIAPLFEAKVHTGLLEKAPTYTEVIHELEDRVVVERRIVVPLAEGTCGKSGLPDAVADLCFVKNPKNKPSAAVEKDLAATRAKLAAAPPTKIVKGTVTAAQALKLDDTDLLELLLNTDTRTIQHVSVVPKIGVAGKTKGLSVFGTKLSKTAAATGLVAGTATTMAPPNEPPSFEGATTHPTEYFLTGFTYGREIDDAWEYTFADSTWVTDRYYVRVDYHVGAGFGVRAPFSIDVKSAGNTADHRDVQLSVDPVDVDENGAPAYAAVGLPANKTFGGKEFVLELQASCDLHISIPGPNIDEKCPSIDLDYSRDIDPVIGSESSKIHDWWLDGSVTGLGIEISVASATLDIGIGADVTNGKVGMRVSPVGNATVGGLSGGRVLLANRNPIVLSVDRTSTGAAGFRLDDPRYGFDVRVTPKLRAKVEVDVAVWEKQWVLGPWSLDVLSVAKSFQLGHHAGTVDKHDYVLIGGKKTMGPIMTLPKATKGALVQ